MIPIQLYSMVTLLFNGNVYGVLLYVVQQKVLHKNGVQQKKYNNKIWSTTVVLQNKIPILSC